MASGNNSLVLRALLITLITVSWCFSLLRFYVRIFMSRSFGYDDGLLLLAQIGFTMAACLAFVGTIYGIGEHIYDMEPANYPKALYYWWLCELVYGPSALFLRLSVAILLKRLCENRIQLWITYITSALVTICSLFYIFIIIFQCFPPSYFWSRLEGGHGTCLNTVLVARSIMAQSGILALTDFVLGCLPIAMLWSLQMKIKLKISVGIILSLGIFAGIAAAIRIPYIHVLMTTDDFFYQTTDLAIWTCVEPGLGLVAAAAAALRPLFETIWGKVASRHSKNHTTSSELHSRSAFQEIELQHVPDKGFIRIPPPKLNYTRNTDSWLFHDDKSPRFASNETNIRSPASDDSSNKSILTNVRSS